MDSEGEEAGGSLMARRPMERIDLRTKSTSISDAYLFPKLSSVSLRGKLGVVGRTI